MRLAAVTLLLCPLLLARPSDSAVAACTDPSLDILLTNDDGFDRPGIRALHDALTAAGHRVTLAAPSRDYSGSGTALSLFDPITLEKKEDGVYAIGATPATTVLLGIRVLFPGDEPPDLVVSGINEGANAGAATIVSGTVGATIVAIRLLPKPVPGIAFSTKLMGEDALSATNKQHFQDVAAFGARLVTSLAERACGKPVLPYRIALNVNYPAKAPADVAGIKLARQGTKSFADISFTEKQPGVYVPVFGPATGPDSPESDATYLARGYITISVLDGDYSTPPRPGRDLASLKRLKP